MVCYPILIGELAKREIRKKDIAEKVGLCYKAMSNRLNGKVPFLLEEAKTIQREFFPDISMDELFATAEETQNST